VPTPDDQGDDTLNGTLTPDQTNTAQVPVNLTTIPGQVDNTVPSQDAGQLFNISDQGISGNATDQGTITPTPPPAPSPPIVIYPSNATTPTILPAPAPTPTPTPAPTPTRKTSNRPKTIYRPTLIRPTILYPTRGGRTSRSTTRQIQSNVTTQSKTNRTKPSKIGIKNGWKVPQLQTPVRKQFTTPSIQTPALSITVGKQGVVNLKSTSQNITQGNYTFTAINSTLAPITVIIGPQTIVFTGCNTFSLPYLTVSQGIFQLTGAITSTQKYCQVNNDHGYLQVFRQADGYQHHVDRNFFLTRRRNRLAHFAYGRRFSGCGGSPIFPPYALPQRSMGFRRINPYSYGY
jgi:hypothetical protein